MRLNCLSASLLVAAAACGGGGGSPNPVPVDSNNPTPDSPVTPGVCPVADTIGSLAFGDGDPAGQNPDEIGPICNTQNNTPCNWFDTPTEGPNANKRTMIIFARLPPDVDQDTGNPDGNFLGVELVSTDGAFIVNNAKNFSTAPDAIGGSLLFQQGTTGTEAIAYIIGNLNSMGSFTHIYSASSGSITLTQVGTNANDKIKGEISAINYREVDGAADVTGGCTTSLDGMIFNVVQGEAAAKRTPPPGSEAEALMNAIKRYKENKLQLAQ